MRVKGIVAYDGSHYYGFQVQKDLNLKTIQGELNSKLSIIFNTPIKVVGSGRTDKGVHALNQVIAFTIDKNDYDLERLKYALNKMLPGDILIKQLTKVEDDFHPRIKAKAKHYRYRISLVQNPFEINYALIYLKKLDLELIKEGMKLFKGKHFFYNFCSNKEEDNDYEKEIFSFELTEKKNYLIFDIVGTGFKRYMVRMIMGTLLALGDHQIDLSYIEEKLNLPLGNNTSYNADPQGLYLVEVIYD